MNYKALLFWGQTAIFVFLFIFSISVENVYSQKNTISKCKNDSSITNINQQFDSIKNLKNTNCKINKIMTSSSEAFLFDNELQWTDLGGGVSRQIGGYNKDLMIVKFKFKKGGVGALHSHFQSQVAIVASGVFELTIDGITKTLRAGDGYLIEPNVKHGALCIEDGVLIDAFSPYREEFLKK